mmetsp:Transcript_4940/g.13064  ORF Transcript_4940/g.13064 Transcript_4940/m.13064 type:complete len:107 (-) Transcript_4940:770-1090(-)
MDDPATLSGGGGNVDAMDDSATLSGGGNVDATDDSATLDTSGSGDCAKAAAGGDNGFVLAGGATAVSIVLSSNSLGAASDLAVARGNRNDNVSNQMGMRMRRLRTA